MKDPKDHLARRSFVTLLGVAGAGAALSAHAEDASSTKGSRVHDWTPTLEVEDDWLELPGRHRLVLDATSAVGAGEALGYAGTYFTANDHGYGLKSSDLAVVLILRHFATPFAYTDAMWAKYGSVFSQMLTFTDPKTAKPPAANLYNAKGYGGQLSNRGVLLSDLVEKHVHFAVCGAATQLMSQMIARSMNSDANDVRAELIANLIPNSHMTAAGIVAVNRAQERGYALAFVG